jgi:hypothetical protein
MSNRCLIYGGCYSATPDRAWLVQQWARLTRRLNPTADIMVFDAASPMFPDLPPDITVHRFHDNIGHLSEKPGELPGDGWGRAMCAGIDCAIARGYDAVAFIETDLLFARPVAEPLEDMLAAGKHFAQPITPARGFRESDLFVADAAWLRDTDLTGRYSWKTACPVSDGHLCPELRLMELTEGSVHVLPYRGTRMNDSRFSVEDCRTLDWLTHADRWEYEAFLERFGS